MIECVLLITVLIASTKTSMPIISIRLMTNQTTCILKEVGCMQNNLRLTGRKLLIIAMPFIPK
jgi:hypothetical protein